MWKCPGCDEDYGGWGDKAPCVISECNHMMCRDCCEKKGQCATCKKVYLNPKCNCVCGAEKYFKPDHNALRLLEEAKGMQNVLAQPLSAETVSNWFQSTTYQAYGNAQPISVIVDTLTGKNIELKNLFLSDPVIRVMLMIQNQEGIPIEEQKIVYKGKTFETETKTGRPIALSAYDVVDGAHLHLVIPLRGC